jgi:hypothetical protein
MDLRNVPEEIPEALSDRIALRQTVALEEIARVLGNIWKLMQVSAHPSSQPPDPE